MADAPCIPDDPFASLAARIGDRPPIHEALRRAGLVVRVETPEGGPTWIVTDEALAREVLSDARFAKDPALAPPHWQGLEPPASQVRSLTTLDGAEHRRLRNVHGPAFTRRRLLARRDRIAAIARGLLAELAEESAQSGQPADLAARFLPQYPLIVVCDLLGVPITDIARAAQTCEAIVRGNAEQGDAGLAELQGMVAAAIRADHDRDTLTDLLAERARAEFGDVSDDEFGYWIFGLVFAGQITTESFLGFLLAHQLGGHLDGSVDELVSEALRLYPPAPFTLWRFTTAELDLAGVTLPAGAPVLVDIEGINTDPSRHPVPYTLDPTRPRLPALTFGDGPHTCIGAHLAHLEACTAVEVLRDDFPHAHLAIPFETLQRDPHGSQSRRLTTLPVWLTAR